MQNIIDHAAGFGRASDAIAAIRAGQFVIVVDDTHRENEGDLIIAAEKITPEQMHALPIITIAQLIEYRQQLEARPRQRTASEALLDLA